jgi:hypothetical protein
VVLLSRQPFIATSGNLPQQSVELVEHFPLLAAGLFSDF